MKFCPRCGQEISETHQYCSKCGEKITEQDENTMPPTDTLHRKKNWGKAKIIGVLCICLSIVFAVLAASIIILDRNSRLGTFTEQTEDLVTYTPMPTPTNSQAPVEISTEEPTEEAIIEPSTSLENQNIIKVEKKTEKFAKTIVYFKNNQIYIRKAGMDTPYPLNFSVSYNIEDMIDPTADGFGVITSLKNIQISDDETKLFYLDYKPRGIEAWRDNYSQSFSLYMKDISDLALQNSSVVSKGTLLKENVSSFKISPDGNKVVYEYYDNNEQGNCVGFMDLNATLDKDFLVAPPNTYYYEVSEDFTSMFYTRKEDPSSKKPSLFRKELKPKAEPEKLATTISNIYYTSDDLSSMVYISYDEAEDKYNLVHMEGEEKLFEARDVENLAYAPANKIFFYTIWEQDAISLMEYVIEEANEPKLLVPNIWKLVAVSDDGCYVFYVSGSEVEGTVLYMKDTQTGLVEKIVEVDNAVKGYWQNASNTLYIFNGTTLNLYRLAEVKSPPVYKHVMDDVDKIEYRKDGMGIMIKRDDGAIFAYNGEEATFVVDKRETFHEYVSESNTACYVAMPVSFIAREGELVKYDLNNDTKTAIDDKVYSLDGYAAFSDLQRSISGLTGFSRDGKNFFYLKNYLADFDAKLFYGDLFYANENGETEFLDNDVSFYLFPRKFTDGRVIASDSNNKTLVVGKPPNEE